MMTSPMGFALLWATQVAILFGSGKVDAQCRAPLTVMLTAQNQWSAWVANLDYYGPVDGDSLIAPYSSVERIMNITTYIERSTVAIGVLVQSSGANRNSLIASVSYNGMKLATTGDTVSRWKYTTDADEIAREWWDPALVLNEASWTAVQTSSVCDANTAPTSTRDGLSYSSFISANGVTPAEESQQYGGTTANWIGMNGNNGDCAVVATVLYRMVLDLTALASAPSCFAAEDGRSELYDQTPIMYFPSIGAKTGTSRTVTVVGGIDDTLDIWADGMGVRGANGLGIHHWYRIAQIDLNIEPKTNNLLAFYVQDVGGGRSIVAQILVDGQTFTMSDPRESWKVYAASFGAPPSGWNTNPNFDDSSWSNMNDMKLCDSSSYIPARSIFINKMYGECAAPFWHSSGCSDTVSWPMETIATTTTATYMTSNSAPIYPTTTATVIAPPNGPILLSTVEIVAIASSATIGSIMMVGVYLFVRRRRSRQLKLSRKTSFVVSQRSTALGPPAYASNWAQNLPYLSTSYLSTVKLNPGTINLTDLSAVKTSLRPRVMGELETITKLSGAPENTVSLHSNHDSYTLPELVAAYQNKLSVDADMPRSQYAPGSHTRTRTIPTLTEHTLVNDIGQGLELPGFLQLKEGIHYNLEDEFATGGGGSLYRGQMFALGLPTLKVIVKRMTNASLPAFRQEVALMWLFNDNENMVKLMGFNEMQLAIVMPEYSLGSLKRFIDAGEYDSRLVRSILLDIAKGLSAMHERGVVHQDIKADNILLEAHPTKQVHAVLTDFGISNVVEEKVLTVKAFEVKNMRGLTLRYAPPEAILRFRREISSRVIPLVAKAGDVYSFAIVVHSLLESVSVSRLPLGSLWSSRKRFH